MNDDPFYSPRGAGVYLGGEEQPIPVKTLEFWRWKGTGPEYCVIGKNIRYRKSALDAFIRVVETRDSAKESAHG